MTKYARELGTLGAAILSVLLLASCGGGGGGGGGGDDPSNAEDEPETTVPNLPPDPTLANLSLAASAGGPRIALSTSSLSLGNGYGFRVGKSSPLRRALAFDQKGGTRSVDLTERVAIADRSSALRAFIAGAADAPGEAAPSDRLLAETLSLTNQDNPWLDDRKNDPGARFTGTVTDGLDVFLSLNGSSQSASALQPGLAGAGAQFFDARAYLAPYDAIAGDLSGIGASFAPTDGTTLTLATYVPAEDAEGNSRLVQKIDLAHRTAGDIELRLGYGWMQEDGIALGGDSAGAFGDGVRSDTQFASVSVVAPLTADTRLFGSYSLGRSEVGGADGLLDDWSTIYSEAFGVGILTSNLFDDGDALSLMLGQPMQVRKGTASGRVAVGADGDDLVFERGMVDLATGERMYAVEGVYEFSSPNSNTSIAIGASLGSGQWVHSLIDVDAIVGSRIGTKF